MAKKSLLYILLMFLCLVPLSVSLAQENCTPATDTPLRLGAIFPKGGLLTARTDEYYEGADAMRQAINACGGVNGHPVDWVFMPAANREDAGKAARHLINEEKVSVIVGSGSLAGAEGAQEIAESSGVVYWEMTEPIEAGKSWVFSSRPTNNQLGSETASFVQSVLPTTLGYDSPRVALVYENRPRGQEVAKGVRQGLAIAPVIDYGYADQLDAAYSLAVKIRENKIDVLILVAFEDDGDSLWFALRQADANIGAWIHIGSTGYKRGLCQRLGNIDSYLSIDVSGDVSTEYRQKTLGDVFQLYRRSYMAAFSQEPDDLADLSASGTYMLLHYVLPQVTGDLTPDAIRAALLSVHIAAPAGMLGEGFTLDSTSHLNQTPGIIVQQQQSGAFCTVFPVGLATCSASVLPFPTWRERALAEERHADCSEQS